MSIHILGMGYAHPTNVIDNKFLEDLDVGTNAKWIEEKIGILTRLTTLPLDYIRETKNKDPKKAIEVAEFTPTQLGVKAAMMALDRAGITPDQIGLIMCNCSTPYQTGPSEAQRIGKELGLKRVRAYDVFTACPAFALHVDLINNMKEESLPEYILGISTATVTQRVDYSDRTDGAIWGDGAAAYVMSAKHEGALEVLYSDYIADPMRCHLVAIDTFGYFHQDGKSVRGFSVLQTVKMLRSLEKMFNLDWNRDVFVGHQANYTMLTQITKNRKIPDSNHWYNVRRVGNQAGASAPAVIAERWEDLTPGMHVAVAVVGAGLSWGSLVLRRK